MKPCSIPLFWKLAGRSFLILVCVAALLPPQMKGQVARQPVRARRAMVASSSSFASQVGVKILQEGGNAVDAAVAVGLALAVTFPVAGNIGGGGFMLIRMADGRTTAIDYRETAPARASRNMYLDANGNPIPEKSTLGYAAVGVPGTVAGFDLALRKYGRLKWAQVVAPARRLAQEGFPVSYAFSRGLRMAERLDRFPDSRRIFRRDGNYYAEGEVFRQPELAATLARLEKRGPREFYEGETARRIAAAMAANGGYITLDDLKNYRPVEREPLRGTYRGYEIITFPPPSSGGIVLLNVLNQLEGDNLAALGAGSAEASHLLIEAMRRAFADRATLMGDPDFVTVPVAELISKDYARARRATIDPQRATPSADIRPGLDAPVSEASETTHFTVVDTEGNIVTNTYTLNGPYGSGVTVPGTGILLNNEMDDFAAKPGAPNYYQLVQGEANCIAPGKRPLSSMTPTIVLKEGRPWFAIGSPGGPTIISTVVQVVINIIDHRMNLQQAIDAPRLHHQWLPDVVMWEPYGMTADTRRALEAKGHRLDIVPRYNGDAEGVMIDETGIRLGASDPRNPDALAVGY
ncbi:gamma-glutamyltransferase [Chloracidobacterium aggregatum]|uniref:Glutathione hydrolase proenzyme n=1 Tax=Chloracidobacterium sp. N TaxID=2821540 RepID=A0ABX8B5N5_9BACT|nr:gamma-glutamyltransferase [Chloracidobacterium aggregatum]QUV86107.1 gamma-glutamyltransferase [Chloracidobacterium sp. 2]QUV89447.1 gamma-glutamyltransferase [Chloracidobacterium sp. S]QUV95025.1 gamma-glutamyltransferase [Chloracidobacterium sp. N]QUV98231.1 gamma-glutamyltransferase [Chloracidobacterium sp. E]